MKWNDDFLTILVACTATKCSINCVKPMTNKPNFRTYETRMKQIDWIEIRNIWFTYHRTSGWRPVCEAGWSKEDYERAIFSPGYFL